MTMVHNPMYYFILYKCLILCCNSRIARIIQLAIGATSVRLDSLVTLRSGPPVIVNRVRVLEHHKKTGR